MRDLLLVIIVVLVALSAASADGDTAGPDEVTVEEAAAGFEARRQRLLERIARPRRDGGWNEPARDLYGNRAVASLALGRDTKAANAQLTWVAEWFDHPHPRGKDHRGESDFAAMRLAHAYHLFEGTDTLTPATREKIRRFFLAHNFQSIYDSENHHLLFRASRYLMAEAMPDRVFEAWGRTGRELAHADADWLVRFLRYRAGHGWGEFDSSCYIRPDFEALLALHDHAPDPRLRKMARMMLDLLLADLAVETLHGMVGGAQGRIYPPHALDHATENSRALFYLYMGNVPAVGSGAVETVTSGYRPSRIVLAIALERSRVYENRERKHLHDMEDVLPETPLTGSICKYTYWTPQAVLGCVQRQDPYPEGGSPRTAVYAYHQQHNWDLSFATNPRARLFTHHPGPSDQHNEWTGDFKCGCGQFFQHRSALLALYRIPEGQQHEFIHAYVPRDAFDEVIEHDDWIFIRAGDAYGALKIVGGYRWVSEGKHAGAEVRSATGRRHAVVCEMGRAQDSGGFEAFRQDVLAGDLRYDRRAGRLTYRSRQQGAELTLTAEGDRLLDGQPADLGYAAYDSPFLQSAWGSGVVVLRHGDDRLVLDFNAIERSSRKTE